MDDYSRCYDLLCERFPDEPSDLGHVADMAEVCVKAERERVLAEVERVLTKDPIADREDVRALIEKLRSSP